MKKVQNKATTGYINIYIYYIYIIEKNKYIYIYIIYNPYKGQKDAV